MTSFMKPADDQEMLLPANLLKMSHPPVETPGLGLLGRDQEMLLPANLLKMSPPLPMETHGLGLLGRDFDIWGSVVSINSDNVPKRSSLSAAGYDLKSLVDIEIPARGSVIVGTGIHLALPSGYYGKIEGRRGLAFLCDVVAFGSVIDEDYRGEIKVKLFNHGAEAYSIKMDAVIAQLVIQKYACPSFNIVQSLPGTVRGTSGFGSSAYNTVYKHR